MGLFRFFLAIQVILTHSNILAGPNLIGGEVEVQSFYMISGFYMALVLNEKYLGKGSYKRFMVNRFLRLAPTYWTVLIISIVFSPALVRLWINHFGNLHITTQIYLIFTNLFMFGQDIILLLRFNPANGMMEFTKNYKDVFSGMPAAWRFLIIAPAWSLGLLFNFYLIAPFILRKKAWFIAALITISFGLRIYLSHHGYNRDTWSFRFFPTELAIFLIGALLYKIYRDLDKVKVFFESRTWGQTLYPKIPYVAIIVLCAASLSFKSFPKYMLGNSIDRRWFYFAAIAWTIPFIFNLTKNSKLDRFIGELSFPIYLIHWIVLKTFRNPIIEKNLIGQRWFNTLEVIYILIVILLAVGAVLMVERPLKAYRRRRFERAKLRLSRPVA